MTNVLLQTCLSTSGLHIVTTLVVSLFLYVAIGDLTVAVGREGLLPGSCCWIRSVFSGVGPPPADHQERHACKNN